MVPRMPVGHIGYNRCHHICHVKTRYSWRLLLAYSDYGALVLQTFHAMPHDVYLLHTVPSYPGNSVIDTHAGRFPNGYVSSGVNAPESALTLKEAMRPDAWREQVFRSVYPSGRVVMV